MACTCTTSPCISDGGPNTWPVETLILYSSFSSADLKPRWLIILIQEQIQTVPRCPNHNIVMKYVYFNIIATQLIRHCGENVVYLSGTSSFCSGVTRGYRCSGNSLGLMGIAFFSTAPTLVRGSASPSFLLYKT